VARCALCTRPDCDGNHAASAPAGKLAWEGDQGGWLHKLVRTARQSVKADASDCLDVNPPRVLRALAFACLAELGALGSLLLPAVAALFVAFPDGVRSLLAQGWPGRILALLVGFMLLVHLLWGVGLELALVWRGARRDLARSVTFALYACGWDLLTSPLGALLLVCSAGPRAGFLELRSAMRVPLAATVRYVAGARGIGSERAASVSRWSFALPALCTLGAVVWLLWSVGGPALGL
jgi:hypothetical protein